MGIGWDGNGREDYSCDHSTTYWLGLGLPPALVKLDDKLDGVRTLIPTQCRYRPTAGALTPILKFHIAQGTLI